jgi:hypothetical protein
MVESIYFLKPLGAGTILPASGGKRAYSPLSRATAFRRWFVTFNQTVTGAKGAANNQLNAQAAFLMGLPANVAKSLQWEMLPGYNWQYGWFIRDRWQATGKLALSFGLRYEVFPLMTRAGRGGIEWWDSGTNLILLGGAGGVPQDVGITTSHTLFAPRMGLAYRIKPSTVIRSGYGLTYMPEPLLSQMRGSYPLTIAKPIRDRTATYRTLRSNRDSFLPGSPTRSRPSPAPGHGAV